jgi:hypothetical protein
MKKGLEFIWRYLTDWKNLLVHALVGVLILAVGLYLPVKPVYRIILIVVIVALNTYRMKHSEQKRAVSVEIN